MYFINNRFFKEIKITLVLYNCHNCDMIENLVIKFKKCHEHEIKDKPWSTCKNNCQTHILLPLVNKYAQ